MAHKKGVGDWLDLLAVQGTLKSLFLRLLQLLATGCISRVFSNTTIQKHQFFGGQLSL